MYRIESAGSRSGIVAEEIGIVCDSLGAALARLPFITLHLGGPGDSHYDWWSTGTPNISATHVDALGVLWAVIYSGFRGESVWLVIRTDRPRDAVVATVGSYEGAMMVVHMTDWSSA